MPESCSTHIGNGVHEYLDPAWPAPISSDIMLYNIVGIYIRNCSRNPTEVQVQ